MKGEYVPQRRCLRCTYIAARYRCRLSGQLDRSYKLINLPLPYERCTDTPTPTESKELTGQRSAAKLCVSTCTKRQSRRLRQCYDPYPEWIPKLLTAIDIATAVASNGAFHNLSVLFAPRVGRPAQVSFSSSVGSDFAVICRHVGGRAGSSSRGRLF